MKQAKNKNIIYKSFEQLKAQLFPNAVDEERIRDLKKDSEKLGACLADQAIEKILQNKSITRRST